MNNENALDPTKLTFSQAYGYEDLPRPLKLGELSQESRAKLWSLLYDQVLHTLTNQRRPSSPILVYRGVGPPWRPILKSMHEDFRGLPADEFFPTDLFVEEIDQFVSVYKPMFTNSPFSKVFDLILAIMRHPECPSEFTQLVGKAFDKYRLAYVLDVSPPPTIYPAATQEEGKAILRATAELNNAGLAPTVRHLRQASDCISRGDYPGAVREGIHAVESTARHFDPKAKTLEPALKALEGAKTLHPALKQAFAKLYGYTCDEQGIRHALIDNPQANVDLDEAVFMLGACASFSSYLARKHQRQVS